MSRRDYVDEIPVLTRTQRRLERRQMWMMVILMVAVTVASFFLGVMVGERSASSPAVVASAGPAVAQVAPPPPPSVVATAPRKLTFYDDLPKGNSAPLGSGINLPKGGYPVPPPATNTAPAASPSTPTAAAPAPAVAPQVPASAPAPKSTAPAVANGGAYVVQVISTRDEAEARRVISKLQGGGVSAQQERVDLGAKGIWYRVVAGPYADQAAAGKVAEKVKKLRYSAIVRKK